MRNIVLARIDDRLIHGQVVTHWCKTTDANTIVIVDDPLTQDAFTQRILKAVSPPSVQVEILTIKDAVDYLKQDGKPGENIMILTKIPQTMEALVNNGVSIKKIILGGMGQKTGRKKLNKNIFTTDEETVSMKRIIEAGVEMWYQLVPVERPVNVRNFF
jgi:PTS system mannose-specific IIB component